MSSSFGNERGIEFNKNINVPASAFLRYDPVCSYLSRIKFGRGMENLLPSAGCQALHVNCADVYVNLFAYGNRKPQLPSQRQGSANFSTKRQIVNIFSFVSTQSLSQLLSPALAIQKQPWPIWKKAGVATFP